MEYPWEDLISHREMSDDDLLNQSQMSSFNEEEFFRDIIVEPPDFSPEESDQSNCTLMKSCSSNSSNNLKPNSSSSTGYVLSFDNSSVHHSALVCSKSRAQSHWIAEPREHSRTKKVRNSCEIKVHIMAERKRRQEMTKSIIALSATIPGLKKTDKASVLREAVNYVKQLQERVKELEKIQIRKERVDSIILMKKTQLCINDKATISYERHSEGCIEELPEVQATVLEKEMLIGILCEKQRQSFLKILSLLNNLHLSITSTSTLQFGTSTVKITIVAQMDDEYNMTIDDLIKTLRQRLLSWKSQDVQK